MRETEADGYITRDEDLTQRRRTCFNCGAYRYFLDIKRYKCIEGHVIDAADWRHDGCPYNAFVELAHTLYGEERKESE